MSDQDDTVPGLTQGEKWRCTKCGCLWRKTVENGQTAFNLWDAAQNTCEICDNSPFFLDNIQRVLEGQPDALTITQEMSDASLTPVGSDQHAQEVLESINEEAASGRKPGAPAGDDTVGNNDNS